MRVNSKDHQPRKGKALAPYIFLAVLGGLLLFLLFEGTIIIIKYLWHFLSLYWHFVIIGILVLLFLRRWFKKKEIVVQKVPQYY